ncbi:MAG TPA: hypothetical protein VMZ53_27255 [Kofleriaceae bacterium]|nr:hypothetical protein [Kofleriaceae bacterium]
MRFAIALLIVAACGDEGPVADPYQCVASGGEACFELPSYRIRAADPMGVLAEPALDCAPFSPSSLGDATFSGHTADYASIVGDVRVEVFSDVAMTDSLAAVQSDADGVFSADIAAMPNQMFVRTTADGRLPTLRLYQRFDVAPTGYYATTLADADVTSMLAGPGDRRLPGKSQLRGIVNDCAGKRLINVVANIAPSSGKNGWRLFEPGVRTYYQSDFDGSFLRRTVGSQTTPAGIFLATNLAPGHHFVQVWGFLTDEDLMLGSLGLKLLAEDEIVVPDADSVVVTHEYARL